MSESGLIQQSHNKCFIENASERCWPYKMDNKQRLEKKKNYRMLCKIDHPLAFVSKLNTGLKQTLHQYQILFCILTVPDIHAYSIMSSHGGEKDLSY